jgi:CDP-diacylglycerol---glycerol-3-phosphate 3-phosphatidyltransferase
MAFTYSPNAIVTPANAVTVARLLMAPILFSYIDGTPSWSLFLGWFVLCATDGIDGYLARRMGTTRSGAFLDPLADKVLVLGALFALVANDVFWVVPVVVIAVRELAISLYRSYAARQGVSVPANRAAKLKTVVQQFAVAFALFPPTGNDATWIQQIVLWVGVGLTVGTGIHYFATARARARASSDGRPEPHAL